MGKFIDKFNNILNITEKSTYPREQYQTFMTGPEWRNVEMAEEWANYLKEGKSMFNFPFFTQTLDLWKVIYHSFRSAKKYDSAGKILSSEYGFMDIFIGVFTTAELMPKALLSLFLKPFVPTENKTEMQAHLANYYTKYAADLQTVPFYDQDYKAVKLDLSKKYKDAAHKTWTDWLSWKCTSAELTARRFISKPLSYWFHQEDNLVPPTTDVLVKANTAHTDDLESTKTRFKNTIADLSASHHAELASEVYVNQNLNKSYLSVYAKLKTPRYATFQETVKVLGGQGIEIRKIAGRERIQVKCVVEGNDTETLKARTDQIKNAENVHFLYAYGDRIHQNRQICLFDVPVKDLHRTVQQLNDHEGTRVKFIHNF